MRDPRRRFYLRINDFFENFLFDLPQIQNKPNQNFTLGACMCLSEIKYQFFRFRTHDWNGKEYLIERNGIEFEFDMGTHKPTGYKLTSNTNIHEHKRDQPQYDTNRIRTYAHMRCTIGNPFFFRR